MKRSNNNSAQSRLHFPVATHDAPRLAISVNERMLNGTAFTSNRSTGLVYSGRQRKEKGKPWYRIFHSKSPVQLKEYVLSEKPGDKRYYPAYMSNSVKVRLLAMEFRKELPVLVERLTAYCETVIDQESTVRTVWPVRYSQRFSRWVNLVKRLYVKICNHSEIVNDPVAFSRILMRGKRQAVIVDFLLKYEASRNSRRFSKLAQQFFL